MKSHCLQDGHSIDLYSHIISSHKVLFTGWPFDWSHIIPSHKSYLKKINTVLNKNGYAQILNLKNHNF